MANERFIKIPLGENNELINDTLDGTNDGVPEFYLPRLHKFVFFAYAIAFIGILLYIMGLKYGYSVPPIERLIDRFRYCDPTADYLDDAEQYLLFYKDLLSTYERSPTYYDRVVDHYKKCTYDFYGNGTSAPPTSTSASPQRQIEHLFFTIKQMQKIMLQMQEFKVELVEVLRAPAYVEAVNVEPEPAEAETEESKKDPERKRRCPLVFCALLREVVMLCWVRPVEFFIDYFLETSDQKQPDFYEQAVDEAGRFLKYYTHLLDSYMRAPVYYARLVDHYQRCFLDGNHSPRSGNSSLLSRASLQQRQRDTFRLLNTLQQMRDIMQQMQELKIELLHETHFFTPRVEVAVGTEPEVGAQLAEN